MKPFNNLTDLCALMAVVILQSGCNQQANPAASPAVATNALHVPPAPMDSCRIVLVPHTGNTRLDEDIVKAQAAVKSGANPEAALERLGWSFVAKARASFDNGYYKLAEQCALCMESRAPTNASALLLHGHVLHNLHKFKEAEPIARQLAAQRGSPMDFGLLGDVLMEIGQLDDAIKAYQQMMDLRPDSRANARAAHVRWLKGDLSGAIGAMQDAVGSVGSRDAESAAWMQTRLAFYHFQAGDSKLARRSCDAALTLMDDYAPALLLRGRMLMAEGKITEAVGPLDRAVKLNPLPEYFWALAEALDEEHQPERSARIVSQLIQHGQDDPRTFSIYLATQGKQSQRALQLATAELRSRGDVFTYDSLAWAQFSAGQFAEAGRNITKALAEGTQDARLFLHAAVIHEQLGEAGEAKNFLQKACALKHLLWPSERNLLEHTMTALAWKPAETGPKTAWNKFSVGSQ